MAASRTNQSGVAIQGYHARPARVVNMTTAHMILNTHTRTQTHALPRLALSCLCVRNVPHITLELRARADCMWSRLQVWACEGSGQAPKWRCVCTISGYHTRAIYSVDWSHVEGCDYIVTGVCAIVTCLLQAARWLTTF